MHVAPENCDVRKEAGTSVRKTGAIFTRMKKVWIYGGMH